MIKLAGITKIYGSGTGAFTALEDVSLQVNKGEFLTIVGASGSGKSTLLQIIGLLSSHNAGSYLYQGTDMSGLKVGELSAVRLNSFGFIFQSFFLLNHLTALENVELPLGYLGVPLLKRRKRAKEMLELVGLETKFKNKPGELSGGEQQRVAIARALVNNPELILADEPTGNLDSKTSQVIIDLLYNLNNLGHTIVLVTHDEKIMQESQRVITLVDGEIKR